MITHNARTLLERLEDPLFLDMPTPAEAAAEIRGLQERLAKAEAELLDTTWQDHSDHWQKRANAALGTANEPK